MSVDGVADDEARSRLGERTDPLSVAFNGTRDMMVLFRVEPGPVLRLVAANTQYMVTLSSLGFDVTAPELTGRTLEEVCTRLQFPADAMKVLMARYVEVVRTRSALSLEERTDTPRGPHYGETVLTPVCDAAGQCTHVLYAARDITDRKLAEQALIESELRARQIFRATPVAMLIAESETGRVLDGNARSVALFGFSESDLLSDFWMDPEAGARFMARVKEGAPLREMELGIKGRSGEPHLCLVSGESLDLGGVRCAALAFYDLTVQRRMEREKHELEAKLLQAQKLEALGTLAGGIAHDFNNILTAIFAYSELALIDADRPDSVHEYVTEIRQAGDRAKQLVRQILAFSRKTRPERRATPLHGVVSEATRLLRSSLPTSIEIRCEVDEHSPSVLADASQIHQIVMNLGTNAAHAMVGKPGVLEIKLQTLLIDDPSALDLSNLKPGLAVLLEVSDTGQGMDDATRRRMFEPFFTTKGAGEGTGLGLAVVHGIVRDHGGAISVTSRIGEGSCFRLYFPALESEPEHPARGGTLPPRGRGEHILLLDDELTVGISMRLLLEHLGYRVSSFSDALEALSAFRQTPDTFDVVISDLTMPKMSGVEFAQDVLKARPGALVFLASGFSGALTHDKVRALGIAGLLTKPFSSERLAVALRNALDGKRARMGSQR